MYTLKFYSHVSNNLTKLYLILSSDCLSIAQRLVRNGNLAVLKACLYNDVLLSKGELNTTINTITTNSK